MNGATALQTGSRRDHDASRDTSRRLPLPEATTSTASETVDFQRRVHGLLGLPFDAVTMDEAVARVASAALARRRCLLVTPNVNFLVAARADRAFRFSVLHSHLSVADGMPIVWWSRWLGAPIRERVAGSDLFERLRSARLPRPLKVYFFGGPPGVAEQARQALGASGGGLIGVGAESPGFGTIESMSSPETRARIEASAADFLVVALGAKRGQEWIEHNRAQLDTPVISHLGAVVNFVASTVPRAPAWMRRVGLEWLARIAGEPGLWRRYWNDGRALARALVADGWPTWRYLQATRAARQRPGTLALRENADATVIELGGGCSDSSSGALRAALQRAAERRLAVQLRFASDAAVDTAILGLLLLMLGHCEEHALAFDVDTDDARLADVLARNGIASLP